MYKIANISHYGKYTRKKNKKKNDKIIYVYYFCKGDSFTLYFYLLKIKFIPTVLINYSRTDILLNFFLFSGFLETQKKYKIKLIKYWNNFWLKAYKYI